MTMLIASLIGIAVLLALLTVWYWFYTDPKRHAPGRRRSAPVESVAPAGGEFERELDPSPPGSDPGPALVPEPRERPEPPMAAASTAISTDASTTSATVPDGSGPAEVPDGSEEAPGPVLASQTWDFVAAARRAEEDGVRIRQPLRPAVPRIQVSGRSGPEDEQDDGDELAVARRRREREAARGLSDEAWESVRRSVFDKLDD